jgi:hypothetical protein
MGTSLLDDGWSHGRKNFTRLESENSVTPSTGEFGENARTGLRGAVNGKAMDGAARGLDLLGVINELAAMKGDIEETGKAMAALRAADTVRDQLAPDQRATLLIDRDTGEMKLLHAGEGYLYDPANKPFAFELKGDDDGICRGNEVPETRSFDVIDRDGQRRKIEFEDWKPEFEKKDKDRDPGDRPRMGHYSGEPEEEA